MWQSTQSWHEYGVSTKSTRQLRTQDQAGDVCEGPATDSSARVGIRGSCRRRAGGCVCVPPKGLYLIKSVIELRWQFEMRVSAQPCLQKRRDERLKSPCPRKCCCRFYTCGVLFCRFQLVRVMKVANLLKDLMCITDEMWPVAYWIVRPQGGFVKDFYYKYQVYQKYAQMHSYISALSGVHVELRRLCWNAAFNARRLQMSKLCAGVSRAERVSKPRAH